MQIIKDPNELTPVQNVKGLLIKREDLFKPFGPYSVNGGKLRQCFKLVEMIKDNYKGVITCCSIHSPQAPIAAAVAKHFNLPCIVCYGGTTIEKCLTQPMPRIAKKYGANIQIISKSGIHKILYNKARKIAEDNNLFVIEYGFNIVDYSNILLGDISCQVENIPNNLDNLIITCGSGITTIGVLLGLNKYNKNVKNIHLVGTAPNREKFIKDTLKKYGCKQYNIIYHDLFKRKGFVYEKGINVVYENIKLHPQYEAKAFSCLYYEIGLDLHNEKNLFWIVGAKPTK